MCMRMCIGREFNNETVAREGLTELEKLDVSSGP